MKKTNAIRMLDREKITYETLSYTYDPNDLNVAKIANENNLELDMIYKSLVLKGDKNGIFVAVIPGDQELNIKAAAQIMGNKKAQLLPITDLEKNTGYVRGGCSPIGMKKNYPVVIENIALEKEIFYINAGTRGLLIGLSPNNLEQVCDVSFGDICQ